MVMGLKSMLMPGKISEDKPGKRVALVLEPGPRQRQEVMDQTHACLGLPCLRHTGFLRAVDFMPHGCEVILDCVENWLNSNYRLPATRNQTSANA